MHSKTWISAFLALATQALAAPAPQDGPGTGSYRVNAWFGGTCPAGATSEFDDNEDSGLSQFGDQEQRCWSWYRDITTIRAWNLEEFNMRLVTYGDDQCLSAEPMGESTTDGLCLIAPSDTPYRAYKVVFN